MARTAKTTKTAKPDGITNVTGNAALITGLGETLEQITTKCTVLITEVGKQFGVKFKDLTPAQIEACYQFGLAERRRRKLARKVGKGSGGSDE